MSDRRRDRESGCPNGRNTAYFLRGLFLVLSCFVLLSLVLSLSDGTKAEGGVRTEPDYPELFQSIDRRLERSYLDLERIHPRNLIERAFSSLELSADEIYVERIEPSNPWVTLHVEDHAEVWNLNNLKTRKDSVELLQSVFEFLARHYHGENTLNELRYAAANGYLSGIDPHTLVFTPKNFEEFEIHIKGEIFGVGMMVGGTEDGKLEVKQVLKDTPAFRAGFLKGDIIAKIDDESTISMTVMEAVQKIRGPKGSEVVLTVKRPSAEDRTVLITKPIAVKRDRVVIKSVESKLITSWGDEEEKRKAAPKRGIGYVQVTNFDQKTTSSLLRNLNRLRDRNGGPLGGLILDLRGNSGGLLTQAVNMSDIFLKSGDIVITAKKGDRLRSTAARDDRMEPDYPIIMLADEESASGAEIVLGALQKNNRGLVLGTRTFGKGSVQQLQKLDNDAQLKITVSEYLIPGNISIQENGVVPDVLAQKVTLDKDYTDLYPDKKRPKEIDYETRIISKYKRDEKPTYRIKYLYQLPEEDSGPSASERFISGDLDPEHDPLVEMALEILEIEKATRTNGYDPRALLRGHREKFHSLKAEFYAEVVEGLKDLGIDWTAAPPGAKEPSPADVELEVTRSIIEEPSADKEDPIPEKKLVVTAKVTNKGDEPIYRIKGISRSDYNPYSDYEFLFGKLAPGESLTRAVKIRLPHFTRAQSVPLAVELSGHDDEVFLSRSVDIVLEREERPALAYTAELRDAEGNLIEKLAPGNGIRMALKIHNQGNGTAHKGVAVLRNKTGREVFLNKGRKEFSGLAAGETAEVEFNFDIREGDEVDTYSFELLIYESYSGESLSRKLEILPKGAKGPGFPNGVTFSPPKIDMNVVTPGGEDPVVATESDEVILNAQVRSKAQNFKAWITSLPLTPRTRNPDKLYYSSSGGRPQVGIEARVPLEDGLNLVTLVAKDTNGIESRRSLLVTRR